MAYNVVQKTDTIQSDPLMIIFLGHKYPAASDANPDAIEVLLRQFPTSTHRAVSSRIKRFN